jgi:hypothetical protein
MIKLFIFFFVVYISQKIIMKKEKAKGKFPKIKKKVWLNKFHNSEFILLIVVVKMFALKVHSMLIFVI